MRMRISYRNPNILNIWCRLNAAIKIQKWWREVLVLNKRKRLGILLR